MQEREPTHTIRPSALALESPEQMSLSSTEDDVEIVFDYVHDDGSKHVSRAWWVSEQLTPVVPVPVPALADQALRQERQALRDRPNSVFMPGYRRDDPQTVATRLGRLQRDGEEEKLLSLVRPLWPTVERLTTITIDNTPVIHAYVKGMAKPMPTHLLGEGLSRLIRLGLAINEASGGLVLIDEIENGLHYKALEEIFCTLGNLAKASGVQIVATTHSDECIQAAHRSLESGDVHEFAYYRLDRDNGRPRP